MEKNIAEIRADAAEFFKFAIAVAFDQHRRHPELPKSRCLKERSFFWQLLKGDSFPVCARVREKIDQADSPEEMNIFIPEIQDLSVRQWRAPDDDPEYPKGHSVRWCLLPGKNWCYLHFHNAIAPKSFLLETEYMKQELLREIADAEKNGPCDTVFTASWLNSSPAFLRFFPQEWRDHVSVTLDGDFGPTTGWQGQFINRFGKLNKSAADYFLQNGILKYPRMNAYCSLSALREHLLNLR